MKNFIKLFGIVALVAVIGFSFVSCSDGGGGSTPKKPDTPAKPDTPTDTWKAVTSLTQLEGTWKTTETNTVPLDDFPTINMKVEVEFTMTFTSTNATTGKLIMSDKETHTFSGAGLEDNWSEIKSWFDDVEPYTVTIDDLKHIIILTGTQEQLITSADDLSDIQINKDGTKIKIKVDYVEEPVIFTKQ